MKITDEIARQFRNLHYGKNWTWSYMKEHLDGLSWQQATTQVNGLNTIVALVYHINYYISAQNKVFEGLPLEAKDALSFSHPHIDSQQDWESLLKRTYSEADKYAGHIENLPDDKLWETFTDDKYGNYYRNIHGVIEHTHYHLGQIVIIKKMILEGEKL